MLELYYDAQKHSLALGACNCHGIFGFLGIPWASPLSTRCLSRFLVRFAFAQPLFVTVLLGTPVGATCPVEFSPSSVVVGYGDSFSTNCTSPSNVTLGMGWESQIDGIPFTEGVSFLTLKIDLVNLWDLSPMCFITGKDQEQCYKPLPIIVYSK